MSRVLRRARATALMLAVGATFALTATPSAAAEDRPPFTDGNGEPMAVTGAVGTPNEPWSGEGERPLIGYAIGTHGLAGQRAPSRQAAEGAEPEAPLIAMPLAAGYAVSMTGYEGFGTSGNHTYFNREATGNAVLDSARAVRSLPVAGLPDDGPVVLMGYSQGGGASAAAVEPAPDYGWVEGRFAGEPAPSTR